MKKPVSVLQSSVVALIALLNSQASAQVTWTGAVDANWSTPGNWSTAAEPLSTDNVLFNAVVPTPPGPVITLSAGEVANTLQFSGSYTLNGGNLTLTLGDIAVDSGVAGTIGSVLSGTTVNKLGAGILVLTGANNHTGLTSVVDGLLMVQNASALGTTAAGTTVAVGAALELQGGFTVTGETLALTGALRNSSGNNTWAGVITVNAGATFDVTAGTTLTVSSSAVGSGAWAKTGDGTLLFSADPNQTGPLTIAGGVVELNHTGATDFATTVQAGATLRVITAAVGDGQTVTVDAGGTYDFRASDTISRLLGGGLVTKGTAGAATLTINSTVNGAWDGVIQDGLGTVSLTKAGSNTVTFSGPNGHTGTTQINTGNITVAGPIGRVSGGGLVIVGDNNGNDESLTLGNNADSITGTLDRVADASTLRFNGTVPINYNGAAAGGATNEVISALDYTSGVGSLNLAPAPGGEVQLAFGSLTRTNNNSLGVIRGAGLGGAAGTADTSRVTFGTVNVLGNGGAGPNASIIPFLIGGNSVAAAPDTFLRYDNVNGVTLLGAADYANAVTGATGQNVSVGSVESVSELARVNALRVTPAGGLALTSAASQVQVSSGALLFTGSGEISGSGAITLGESLANMTGASRQGLLILSSDTTATATISARLATRGGLVIGDAGTAPNVFLLSGDNQIAGGIVVNNGILRLGSSTALNDDYFNDLVLRAGNSVTTGATSTALQLNGNNASVIFAGADRLQGSTRIQNASANPATLTIVATAASTANDGILENGTGGGALSVIKRGTAQVGLEQANSFTGAMEIIAGNLLLTAGAGALSGPPSILVSGATLQLTNTATNNTNRINNAASVSLVSGTFDFDNNANAGTAFSETIGSLQVTAGASTVVVDRSSATGSAALTAGSLARTAGATLNLASQSNGTVVYDVGTTAQSRIAFTTAPTLDDGIIGGWMTVDSSANSREFAKYSSSGVVSATALTAAEYTTALASGPNPTQNVKLTGGAVTLTQDTQINSLNLAQASGTAIDLGGLTTRIESGGVLVSGRFDASISNGTLTAGNGANTASDLIVHTLPFNNTGLAWANATDTVTLADMVNGTPVVFTTAPGGLTAGTIYYVVNATATTFQVATAPGGTASAITNDGTTGALNALYTTTIGAAVADNGAGAVNLVKTGASILALAGANTYTGNTYINQGILNISSDNNLGQAPVAPVANKLQLYGGTLNLTAGTVTLDANRGITIGGGTSTIAAATGANLVYNGTITGSGAAGLILSGNVDMTLSGATTLGGGLSVLGTTAAGGAVINLGGPANVIGEGLTVANSSNSATLLYNVPGGVLSVGAGSPNTSFIDIGSRTAAAASVANVGLVDLTGSAMFIARVDRMRLGVLTVDPPTDQNTRGTLILPTSSDITVGTDILISDSPNDGLSTHPSRITFGAGTSNLTASLVTIGGRKGNGTINVAAGGTLNYTGFGPGTGDLWIVRNNQANTGVTGAGTFDMSAGTLVADLDEVVVGHKSGTGGGVGGANGTFTLGNSANVVRVNSLILGDSQGDSSGTATGTLNMGGGTFAARDNVSLGMRTGTNGNGAGVLNVNGGTFTVGGNIVTTGGANSTSTVNVNGGTLDLTGGTIAADNFTLQAGTLRNVAEVFDDTGATPVAVNKTTGGQVVFEGVNAYTGATTVSAGTLLVSGSLTGSAVTVTSGTLGGIGSITNGAVIGDALAGGVPDAILSPGVNIGTLSTGDIALLSDAQFVLEINSTTRTTDLLASSGFASLGLGIVPLVVSDLGGSLVGPGERFTFFTAGNQINGTFAGLPDGTQLTVGLNTYEIDYTTTSVSLVAVPEPSAAICLLGGLGSLVALRRRRLS